MDVAARRVAGCASVAFLLGRGRKPIEVGAVPVPHGGFDIRFRFAAGPSTEDAANDANFGIGTLVAGKLYWTSRTVNDRGAACDS